MDNPTDGSEPVETGGSGTPCTSPYAEEQALALAQLTSRFYRENADSFDSTRQRPWDGWKRLANVLGEIWQADGNRTASDGGIGGETHTGTDSPFGWPKALSWGQAPSLDSADDGIGDARAASDGRRPSRSPGAATDGSASRRRVLDLGCGNLRFERFLEERFPDERFEFECIDDCTELVGPACSASDAEHAAGGDGTCTIAFKEADIVGTIAHGGALPVESGAHDLSVAFGFMHHIPGEDARMQALRELSDSTGRGGIFAVSLWRFADDIKTRWKARRTTATALEELSGLRGSGDLDLAPGDYLLGWQDRPGVFRYCHSFDDAEVERMVSALEPEAWLIDRYRADGRGGRANEYLVFARL